MKRTPPLIHLRPRDDSIHTSQSRTALITGRDGFISGGTEHGLFVHETRLLSQYRWLIDGKKPQPVALSNVEQHSWLGYYITLTPGFNPGPPDEGSGMMSPISQHTLELRLNRYVTNGFREKITATNFTRESTSFRLSLELDADFADVAETRRGRIQKGKLLRSWKKPEEKQPAELHFDYRAKHHYDIQNNRGTASIHRAVTIRIATSDSPPLFHNGEISFEISLAPLGAWHAEIEITPMIDGEQMPVMGERKNDFDRKRSIFLNEATDFAIPESETLAPVVLATLRQARRDLSWLRLHDLDIGDHAWSFAAGLPIYLATYGRDLLTAAWQTALLSPDPMCGALTELAQLQGVRRNDWRDEMPGRMLHEAHTGPLAALRYNPHGRYYGSITTSSFYSAAVAELWHWTGDKELVRPFIGPALAALRCVDIDCERFNSIFHHYKTRSKQGVRHQAWKDSADAIVRADGSQVDPPIATCEEQGFVYLAKLHLSEVLWWLDEKEDAKRLFHEASELKKRFNEAFWMEEEKFFAMGLDADSRHIRSIGSNAGHCLATGIADSGFAETAADRLMQEDLFSGWGIRTLSDRNPAYNPYSYHRGSVWPVEQGTFALGFMRYGLHKQMQKLCRAQFEAAALFEHHRLPELFSGHTRSRENPFPALYPQANSPQAWSASATFSLLQSLLGLYPYAPLHLLLVDPHLPEWLPSITLKNLRVGKAVATIRFFRRKNGESSYEIMEKRGSLHLLRQPSPWSLTATWPERLVDLLTSLLPGR